MYNLGSEFNLGKFMKLLITTFFLIFSLSSFAQKKIIFLGDSLTEGYGIDQENAYPALLQKKFDEKEKNLVELINAGISGSTSASGISRVKWFLKAKPYAIFLALGANDGLRGLELPKTEKNLKEIIELAKENGIKVWLAGMMLPTNYGEDYRKNFQKMYEKLAKEYKLPFYPFLLKDVGGVSELNIADGIHPNEKGHQIIARDLYPFIQENL